MKYLRNFFLAALFLVPLSAYVLAYVSGHVFAQAQSETQPAPAETITITNAYTFATPGEAESAAVFMTLTYPTGNENVPDRLMGATTPAAEKAELHTMSIDNGVMAMRPIDSLPLPPTGIFTLKPQGVHVMLSDMNRSLKIGDKFPVTMVFEKAGMIVADVVVRPPGVTSEPESPVGEPPEEKEVHQDMMMDGEMHHHVNR